MHVAGCNAFNNCRPRQFKHASTANKVVCTVLCSLFTALPFAGHCCVLLQVPYLILTACGELMAAHKPTEYAAALAAQCMAAQLVSNAAAVLPPLISTSGSSGSGQTGMLWQQLEQSGILHQLPAALRLQVVHITTNAPAVMSGLPEHTVNVLQLLRSLQRLYPSFLTDHAAGQQCVGLIMQLALTTLQYVSRELLAQSGRHERLQCCLCCAWDTASAATFDIRTLLERLCDQQTDGASSSSSSSTSNGAAAALAVLQDEHILRWACMNATVVMVAQFLHLATATSSTTSTTSSSSSSTSRDAGGSSHRSRQLVVGNMPGRQWLPAALAHSMPAAYSSVLEQLGCSREVGLWLATQLTSGWETQQRPRELSSVQRQTWLESIVAGGLELYDGLMRVLADSSVLQPQLAALQLSAAAAILQWLSSMPTGRLRGLLVGCQYVCQVAERACSIGQVLMFKQIGAQRASGGMRLFISANQALAQLSADVLTKLLGLYRSLEDSGESSTGACSNSSSISASSNGSSSVGMLGQSCQHIMDVLACHMLAAATAIQPERDTADTASLTQPNSPPGQNVQLPVQRLQCCKLLQDGVRMLAAAAPPADAMEFTTSTSIHLMLQLISWLLCGLESPAGPSPATTGPLVAPIVAAGDVSSPDAVQLFGLLCSLLKACPKLCGISKIPADSLDEDLEQEGVSTAVLTAVSDMLKVALDMGSRGTHLVGNSSSCSSSDAGSSACTAALPWVVLLGRCCGTCDVLMQHCQHSLESDDAAVSLQPQQWTMHRQILTNNMQLLQASLTDVVQWLAADNTVQQLTALGYKPQDLQQQLAAAAEALPALSNDLQAANPFTDGHAEAVAALQAAQEQLLAAGSMLACFAISHVCNNPACGNMAGPSEAQLVGGRSCICAGCRTARYCGIACQRTAWRQHKPVCKALAAAAAAATQST
jgi:hypothetical protein